MNLSTYGLLPVLGFLILLTLHSSDAAPSPPFRNRNLIPFPRVGRRDLSQDLNDLDKIGPEFLTETKIRRSGDNMNNNNMKDGLWFGPRFGRIQKRRSYLDDAMGYLLLRDLSSYKHTPKYTPRLGRESEEILEDLNETNQTSY